MRRMGGSSSTTSTEAPTDMTLGRPERAHDGGEAGDEQDDGGKAEDQHVAAPAKPERAGGGERDRAGDRDREPHAELPPDECRPGSEVDSGDRSKRGPVANRERACERGGRLR